MRTHRSFGRRELNRWYQDFLLILPLDFLQFKKSFHVITPPFHCVHLWMLSLFTAFTREGGGNVWHTSAPLAASSPSKECRELCICTPKILVLMVWIERWTWVERSSEHEVAQCTAKTYVLDNWGVLLSCLSQQASCLAVWGQSFRLDINSVFVQMELVFNYLWDPG